MKYQFCFLLAIKSVLLKLRAASYVNKSSTYMQKILHIVCREKIITYFFKFMYK